MKVRLILCSNHLTADYDKYQEYYKAMLYKTFTLFFVVVNSKSLIYTRSNPGDAANERVLIFYFIEKQQSLLQ